VHCRFSCRGIDEPSHRLITGFYPGFSLHPAQLSTGPRIASERFDPLLQLGSDIHGIRFGRSERPNRRGETLYLGHSPISGHAGSWDRGGDSSNEFPSGIELVSDRVLYYLGFEGPIVLYADHALHGLSVDQEEKRGNIIDAELLGELWQRVHVDFRDSRRRFYRTVGSSI